jgi:hypothetical protein
MAFSDRPAMRGQRKEGGVKRVRVRGRIKDKGKGKRQEARQGEPK